MELEKISQKLGAEGHQLIFDICKEEKYRLPGSEGEANAQEYMKKKMKDYGADEIEVQEFTAYSKFFKWWPKLSFGFFLVSLVTYHFSAFLTMLLIILMLANIGFKLFSFTVLDVFFKKHPSSNVIAKLKPKKTGDSGKPKRVVIFGGHIDSTYEFPLGRMFGKKMIYFYGFVFLAAFYWLLINFIRFIFDIVTANPIVTLTPAFNLEWYYISVLILTPFVGWVAWNVVSTRPVQGANDNLSGIAVTSALLKYFSENPLENVELWSISFGSEEGGMAGSKALSKKIKKEIEKGSFPAESLWVVNFDSIAQDAPLVIATAEPMYRVKSHDPEVYNQLYESAKKAGVDTILKKIDAGTDSAPFTRLEIPAVGAICAGEDGIPKNWHSREDIPDYCDTIGITRAIQVGIQFLLDVDSQL